MASQLVQGTQMEQIYNALIVLIIAILGGSGTVIGAFVLSLKWWIPRRFKLQTEEREARLVEFRQELDIKRQAETVDIEQQRMLPQMLQSNQALITSMLSLSQSFNTTMQQKNELEASTTKVLDANTRVMTDNTKRLEELASQVDTVIINLQQISTASVETNNHSRAAAQSASAAAAAAQATLTIVQNELANMIRVKKGDSKELPRLTDIAELPPAVGQ